MTVTLAQLRSIYASELQLSNRSPRTIETNDSHVRRLEAWLVSQGRPIEIDKIKPEDIGAYVAHLQSRETHWPGMEREAPGRLSAYTVNQCARILRGFGHWLARGSWPNPFEKLPIPKTPKLTIQVLTDEEIQRLVGCLNPKTQQGARALALIMVMLGSGARVGEVAKAKLDDFTPSTRTLRVFGKGAKWRDLPLSTKAVQALLKYIHAYRGQPVNDEAKESLFLSLDGYALGINGIQQIVRRLSVRANIPRLYCHLMRHTFAVQYLMAGGDIVSLQTILGHEDIAITRRYLHLTGQDVRSQFERVNPIDKILEASEVRRFGRGPKSAR